MLAVRPRQGCCIESTKSIQEVLQWTKDCCVQLGTNASNPGHQTQDSCIESRGVVLLHWSLDCCLDPWQLHWTQTVALNAWRLHWTQDCWIEPRTVALQPVLRIHDILVWIRIRIRGSMPLTNGFCYFCHWRSRYQQKTIFLKIFSAYCFLKVHLHHFKDKKSKRVTKL